MNSLQIADRNLLVLACACVADLLGTHPEGCNSIQGLDD